MSAQLRAVADVNVLVSAARSDDDYLLALARSAKVGVLISGDRDLTDLAETQPPIETPAQFSQRLA